MNNSLTEPEGIIAIVDPAHVTRARWWDELFGGRHVPVKSDEAVFTILPDSTEAMCYFVDFTSCPWLKPRIKAAMASRPKTKNNAAVANMVDSDMYPLVADGVTVMRAPLRLLKGSP